MKNTFLSFLAFLCLLNANAQFNLDSGLVSYLSFDGKIEDNSVNGYTVEEHGIVSVEKMDGNSFLMFDEASGVEIKIPDTLIYAVSFYVKGDERIDALSKIFIPISFVETGTPNSQSGKYAMLGDFSSLGSNEKVSLIETSGSGGRTFMTEGELDDKWHHIVYNYSGGKYDIYIDGVKKDIVKGNASNHVSLINMINPVVGTKLYPNGSLTSSESGSIDEVRFYNRSITVEEVDYLSSEKDWSLNDDLIFHLGFENNYDDQSLNEFTTETIGNTEIKTAVTNSYLSFSEVSGVKVNIPDTSVYAISFYVKGEERIDALSKIFIPISFVETGTPNSQSGKYAMLGDFSSLGSNEKVSLIETSGSGGRTFMTEGELDDKWHHIVYNYSGGKYDIYIDGVKKNIVKGNASSHVDLISMINPVIGTREYPNGSFSSTSGGSIDEVKAFSRSLTINEIQWLANELDWEMLITSNELSVENMFGLYPTILKDGEVLSADEEVDGVVFYDVEGVELASYSTLKDLDISILSKGVNFARVIFRSGEVITQKIIKQ